MSRKVEGLVWAKRADVPVFPPTRRSRGPKALGLRYERQIKAALPAAEAGIWWQFQDENGPGACQTDFLLLGREFALVLEAKYTYTQDAWPQLFELYRPVVERATGRAFLGVQICKILTPEARNVVHSLQEANRAVRFGGLVTLHWSGIGPL